jgi:hypothetical protein
MMHGWVQRVENRRKWGREGLDVRYTVLLCAVFLRKQEVAETYEVSSSKMRKNNDLFWGVPSFIVFGSCVFLIFIAFTFICTLLPWLCGRNRLRCIVLIG